MAKVIDFTNKVGETDLKKLFCLVVGQAHSQEGLSISEIRQAINVIDKAEAAQGNVVKLEDSEWKFAKTQIEKAPWTKATREILEFSDKVINPEEE